MNNYLNLVPYYLSKFFLNNTIIYPKSVPGELCNIYEHLYGIDLYGKDCFAFNLSMNAEINKFTYGVDSIIIIKYDIPRVMQRNMWNVDVTEFNGANAYVVFVPSTIHDENGIEPQKLVDIIIELVMKITKLEAKMLINVESKNLYLIILPSFITALVVKNRFYIDAEMLRECINTTYKELYYTYTDNDEPYIHSVRELEELFKNYLIPLGDRDESMIMFTMANIIMSHRFTIE